MKKLTFNLALAILKNFLIPLSKNYFPTIRSISFFLIFCIFFLKCSSSEKELALGQSDLETVEVDMMPKLQTALFELDRGGSYLGFQIMHLGINNVRGNFNQYAAAVLYNPEDPLKTSVSLQINVKSIDTRSRIRDRDLLTPDFFDESKYPFIHFESKLAKKRKDGTLLMVGDLTIKDVTKTVEIPFRITTPKVVIIPGRSDYVIHVEGEMDFNRNEFNVTGGDFTPGVLADEVKLEFSLLLRQQNFDKISFNPQGLPSIGQKMYELLSANKTIEEAIELFKTLEETTPDQYNFHLFGLEILARKLMFFKKYQDALTVFHFMIEKDPTYLRAYLKIGEIFSLLNQQNEALAAFSEALGIDSTNVVAIEMTKQLILHNK